MSRSQGLNIKNALYLCIQACLAVIPFILTYYQPEEGIYKYQLTDIPEMEHKFFLFFGILALISVLNKLMSERKSLVNLSRGLGIFFALATVIGYSYEHVASWDLLFSKSCFIPAVLMIAGYYILFSKSINAVGNMILSYNIKEYDKKYFSSFASYLDKVLKKNGLLKIWLFIMLFWLPYLIIDYPAVVHADSGVMLGEYMSGNLSNHHPVLQTLFFGSFVKFGENAFGSQSVGVFLFALLQYLYGSFIMALLFDYVRKKGAPLPILFFALLVICIMPAFPRNATAVCKDSNYTFYLMFVIYLMMVTVDRKDMPISKNRPLLVLWFFAIILTCFSRKNGIHVLILSLPFLLIYMRKSTVNMLACLFVFIISFSVYFGGEMIITDKFNIGNNDTRESLSIPFQQTARYVRDYGEDVTEEEKQAIEAVLDYENLATNYNPELSDPVKGSYKDESTSEDLRNYLSVWFREFFRHPDAYVQATLNNVYGYFYPDNIGYYKDLFFMSMCIDENVIHGPETLEKMADKLVDLNMKSRNLPVIGVFSSLGFFVWADIFITLFFLIYKKDKKFIIYNIPCLVTILICIAGPVNNTMRYGLPIMFMVPILFGMCFDKAEERK